MPATRAELDEMARSFRGALSGLWSSATSAPSGDLGKVWTAAADHGWTAVVEEDLLDVALMLQGELGRLACPLPLFDGLLAVLVGGGRSHAGEDLASAISAGRVRATCALADLGEPDNPVVRHVEAAGEATHLLAVDPGRGLVGWYGLVGATITPQPGTPIPSRSEVRPAAAPAWVAPYTSCGDLTTLAAVGSAARALGAVARCHELAVAHATDRRQFGHPIGHFQAVSHRLVRVEIELAAARQLLARAVAARRLGPDDWAMSAAVYLEHASAHIAPLQFDAHHTLAAIGYFEEHEAPWLFRRAHADLSRLRAFTTGPTVGEMIVDAGAPSPAFDLGPQAEALRRQVTDAFAPWSDSPSHLGRWDDDARRVLRERGWIGVGWPEEVGGGGLGTTELLAFSEALAYADPPLGNILMGINSVAPVLIRVGTDQQQQRFLGELRRGDVTIALGYSESEAGSDLASLRTRADAVDGGWIINGSKMWGTCLPDAQYILLAARTDPEAPTHAGISLFLVDAASPGISTTDHVSLAGEISSTSFWDDVFVPEDRLIGGRNEGWRALASALAGERVLIGATVMRVQRGLDRFVAVVRERPELVAGRDRHELLRHVGRLTVRAAAARALVIAGVEAAADGSGQLTEAPMAKVIATELAEDFNATAVALLGPDALVDAAAPGAVGGGFFELGLRTSIMGVVSGGTNDIQRNLIARGMGLPR